jgi:hypothetical protein
MVGDGPSPRVVQPLWPDLPVQVSQEKTKGTWDIPEWFIEQLIEDIIPNARAHS